MTNPLKTEHAIDWRKTAQEIEDQFQAGMIERDRYRMALEGIKARLSTTDVPQDEWVKTLHGEIFALAAYALRYA